MFSRHICHHFTTLRPTCVWDFLTNTTSVAGFPWWSSGPPYSSAAWGQREPWVQLAALAATWCSTPRSGGPNPRKLCEDGARIKGIGASAVGSGWHVRWDETMTRLFKTNQSWWNQTNIVINLIFVCIYLPYQTGAELCPSIVSPLYSEVEVPPERGGDFLTPRHGWRDTKATKLWVTESDLCYTKFFAVLD